MPGGGGGGGQARVVVYKQYIEWQQWKHLIHVFMTYFETFIWRFFLFRKEVIIVMSFLCWDF